MSEHVTTGIYQTTTWRTTGTNTNNQHVFTLENPSGSGVILAISRLEMFTETTAALASVAPVVKLSRIAMPSGGSTLVPESAFTIFPNPKAIPRAATASDGGSASTINATAGTPFYSQFVDRFQSAVGQASRFAVSFVNTDNENGQIAVRQNEAILVSVANAASTNTSFILNCRWTEFDIP